MSNIIYDAICFLLVVNEMSMYVSNDSILNAKNSDFVLKDITKDNFPAI